MYNRRSSLPEHPTHTRNRKIANIAMQALTGLATLIAILPLIWILTDVIRQGTRALSFDFFTKLPTPVGVPGGGLVNALVGSAITVGLAALMATPVGVFTSFYLTAYPNTTLSAIVRFATDVISGVPSIIMGIFAYTLVVLPQRHFSAFSGAVVLAFIMLPILVRTTEEMLRLVPRTMREGSLALGAPEWRTSLSVLLPAAADGVLTGLMLAIARAAGEAAPMLFTAFGNPFMSTALGQPIATLPQTIFVYANSPYADWHAKAWATALVLIVLVFVLNALARLLIGWRARRLTNMTH